MYRKNILNYRDIWRAALDPLGIILNRHGDGIEIDFYMTPIPVLDDNSEAIIQILEKSTKDSLSFITNPKIRIGILS